MKNQSISMKRGGYYSQHTKGAQHVINRAGVHVLEQLSQTVLENRRRPFSIVDYGAADGGTSLELISRIIQGVRERTENREITVTYTDLPHNDFSALFQNLHDRSPESESYLTNNKNVFAMCAGTSFYQQIVPDNSVDVAFSATAMHWLSGLPGTISDHVHAVGAKGQEWRTFRDYALNDWETILLHRARELVPGGIFVMANFCIDEQGRYLGNTGGRNMFDTFHELWTDLKDSGVITKNEWSATTFPQFYKTIDQFSSPFDDPESAVSQAGLRLISAYTGVTKCPYRSEFNRVGDEKAFADAYVPTLRSWSETVFRGGLSPARSEKERSEIVDRFYANYHSLVQSQPELHAMDYVHTYMVIRKND